MELTTPDPVELHIRIREDSARDTNGRRDDALVDVSYQADVSQALLRSVGDGVQRIAFNSFPVEPDNVQREISEIRMRMHTTAVDALNVVRWSVHMHGPAEPLRDLTLLYSLNLQNWRIISGPVLVRVADHEPQSPSPEWHSLVQSMLDTRETEPTGHSLFRAAWDALVTNPRAGLFLGVAALEVATKECIARLVPETTWLVDNLQAPPVHRLIKDYLAALLEPRGNLHIFAPPKELVRTVQEAIEHRNTLAHKLATSNRYQHLPEALSFLTLEEFLLTVEDLLYLYDLYTGHPAALEKVRLHTRRMLEDRAKVQRLPIPVYGSSKSPQ